MQPEIQPIVNTAPLGLFEFCVFEIHQSFLRINLVSGVNQVVKSLSANKRKHSDLRRTAIHLSEKIVDISNIPDFFQLRDCLSGASSQHFHY